jgi:ABC-2 type transport system permease protein
VNWAIIAAGGRLQLAESRHDPRQFFVLLTAPIFSTIFLSVALHARSSTALVTAVLGPAFIGLWLVSLDVAAATLGEERQNNTLEPMLATPASLHNVVFGRVLSIAAVGLVTMIESWVVAAVGFGVVLVPRHPWILAVALVVTLFATAGTATFLAGAFILTREAFILQNSLSYPFYILGGVLLPVTLLPSWLQPLSRLIFLSWSTDLVRAAFGTAPVAWQLPVAVIVGLGVAALVGSRLLVKVAVSRVARTGSAVRA